MWYSPDTQEVEQEQNGFTGYEIMAIYALTCTKAYVYDILKCTSRRKTKESHVANNPKKNYFEPLITSCDANGVLGSTSEFPNMALESLFMSKKHPF